MALARVVQERTAESGGGRQVPSTVAGPGNAARFWHATRAHHGSADPARDVAHARGRRPARVRDRPPASAPARCSSRPAGRLGAVAP